MTYNIICQYGIVFIKTKIFFFTRNFRSHKKTVTWSLLSLFYILYHSYISIPFPDKKYCFMKMFDKNYLPKVLYS